MAYKGAPVGIDKKWQIEDDERTLQSAASVVADKVRLKNALACMKKKQTGVDKLVRALGRSGIRGRY